MTGTTTGFAHQRLDAFHVAMELTIGVERLAVGLPRGHADLKDQVRRAASATMRNITEGANRWAPRDKAARFVIARGECGECDAALELVERLRLGPSNQVRQLRNLADRVGAMLTGLIQRHQQVGSAGQPRMAPPQATGSSSARTVP
ncbi:MAG: four helix bundle protein [Planctomycetota bacterium]|nr:four helix bundle protein [Planctomycetota bacterium]